MKKNYNMNVVDFDRVNNGKGYYSEEEGIKIAKELVSELENAFLRSQKHTSPVDENIKLARITYNIKKSPSDMLIIHVNFPAKYLFRPSLWKESGYRTRTGEGIEDIFALFTNGYRSNKKMASGYWWSDRRDGEIGYVHAPNFWPPNKFISETISAFEASHPGVRVEYPEEWH